MSFLDYIDKEMKTLKNAPILCIVLVLIGIGIAGWHYDYVLDAKDALIALQKEIVVRGGISRPILIFNAHGEIEVNLGAKVYIKNLNVEWQKNKDIVIELETTEHLAYPPLITSIDTYGFKWSIERNGERLIIYRGTLYMSSESTVPRFKMEIWG